MIEITARSQIFKLGQVILFRKNDRNFLLHPQLAHLFVFEVHEGEGSRGVAANIFDN